MSGPQSITNEHEDRQQQRLGGAFDSWQGRQPIAADGQQHQRLGADTVDRRQLDDQHDCQEAAAAMEVTATVGQQGSRPQ